MDSMNTKKSRLLCRFLQLCLVWNCHLVATAEETEISRIAFGSCVHQDHPQPIWTAVCASQPDLFVFMGDNIYGDTEDMAVLQAKYDRLAANPGFRQLRGFCPIIGTWDDHDYGENDAGTEYPRKRESQKVMLDFFQVPQEDPRRNRPGVYRALEYGPPDKQVQVILLDTRYFRSSLGNRVWMESLQNVGYLPNKAPGATILGEDQWRWLEAKLKEPARIRVIVSSIQILPKDHGYEKWANFPQERQRLLDLIRQTQAEGVVFFSGDRHRAEISRLPGEWVGYPLYELTSSGLTQVVEGTEPNQYRLGSNFAGQNFGMLVVDWKEPEPVLTLEVRDVNGRTVLAETMGLGELRSH